MDALQVQIFGLRSSAPTRAAERFFKERRATIHFVDLAERPLAKGELTRFVQKFGLSGLLDQSSKAYERSNLAYLRIDEAGVISKIIAEPLLLRLPLVRSGKFLSTGQDEELWQAMVDGQSFS